MDLGLNLILKGRSVFLKNRILVIAIAVALLSLLYAYFRIYIPVTNEVRRTKEGIHKEGLNADILKRIVVLQDKLSTYEACFAKESEILWLVDRVSRAANDSGLNIIALNSKPLVSLNRFLYSKVNLEVSGEYHQLGDFVAKMENSGEFIRIEKLSFRKDKESLKADVIIATYFWK